MDYAHSIEFKFANVEAGKVSGYASIFGNVDQGSDVIEAGAFAGTIMGRDRLPMLHEHRDTVGTWHSFREDAKGLLVEGRISNTQLGRDVRTLAKDGAIGGLSIGYIVKDADYQSDGVRVIREVDLVEVSLTTFPMNQLAQLTSAKSALARGDIPRLSELEYLLRQSGLSRRQAKRLLRHGYSGLSNEHTAAELIGQMAARLEI
jgi:HK97 family phage prohead protease